MTIPCAPSSPKRVHNNVLNPDLITSQHQILALHDGSTITEIEMVGACKRNRRYVGQVNKP